MGLLVEKARRVLSSVNRTMLVERGVLNDVSLPSTLAAYWDNFEPFAVKMPRFHNWHLTTQQRLFMHLRKLWPESRARIMVDLGCHAGHGPHVNVSDALLWLNAFGHEGGEVLGVDAFEDFATDLQHRFDNVEPYASMRSVRKRALGVALAATDGELVEVTGLLKMHLRCCYGGGGWCGSKWERLEEDGVIDHLCRIPRQRLRRGTEDVVAARNVMPRIPASSFPLKRLRELARVAERNASNAASTSGAPKAALRVNGIRAETLWRQMLGGRRIDLLKVDVDMPWTKMGLRGLVEARGFRVMTIEVDASWRGTIFGWGVTLVDQLVWLANAHGYEPFLKVRCRARRERPAEDDGADSYRPQSELSRAHELDGPDSAFYLPLLKDSQLFVPTRYSAEGGPELIQDMMLVDRLEPGLARGLQDLGEASCERRPTHTRPKAALGAARRWVQRARAGYCARTVDSGRPWMESCLSDDKGVLPLSPQEAAWWPAAAQACLSRCARCQKCRFVSISSAWKDCSFFASCDLTRLRRDIPDFRSGALPQFWNASLDARDLAV
jgi:hypothetical protein